MNRSRRIGKWVTSVLERREYALVALILLASLMVGVRDARFFEPGNLLDILVRSAPTAIVACGLMLVVVTGEIDISVGSLMGLLAAALGIFVSSEHWNWPLWIGVPATLLLGTLVGACTGLLVAIGRVPSIIATLGLLSILRGATTLVMQGRNIAGLPGELTSAAKYGALGVPLGLWVAAVVIAVTAVLITHTPLGRRLYALGSSPHAARMVGLSEWKLKLFAFAYVGFLTALATIVDVPRLPNIEAGIGVGFELLVVTCVVVGGVSIAGGQGSIWGVLLAVLLMTMVRPVLTFLELGESGEKWTKAIQGGFILAAVVADSLYARWPGRRGM